MALVGEAWHLLLALFVVGWFVPPLQASVSTLVQSEVDDAMRGRTGAALSTVLASANVASMALAGVSAAMIGVRGVFVAAGIIGLVAGATTVALFRAAPAPRRVATDPEPAVPSQIMVSPPDTESV